MDSGKVGILSVLVFFIFDLCVNVVVCIRLKRRKEENDRTREISSDKVDKESDQ